MHRPKIIFSLWERSVGLAVAIFIGNIIVITTFGLLGLLSAIETLVKGTSGNFFAALPVLPFILIFGFGLTLVLLFPIGHLVWWIAQLAGLTSIKAAFWTGFISTFFGTIGVEMYNSVPYHIGGPTAYNLTPELLIAPLYLSVVSGYCAVKARNTAFGMWQTRQL